MVSYAWVDVWSPQHGWAGIDATNDRIVDDRYVRVAHGRDYGDVDPVKDVYRGAEMTGLDGSVSLGALPRQEQ